jgi:hypothetical protein
VLPLQQGAPGVPQVAHKPLEPEEVEHTVPATQRSAPFVPGQQVPPAAPQGEQIPLRQERPAWHEVPQQAWPEAPQPAHFPAPQTPGLVPLLPPLPAVALPQVWPSPMQVSL